MPLLTKIRESMTKIFAIFAGIFVVYIVLDWGMDLVKTKQTTRASEAQMVGFINGEGIPFRQFSELVQQGIDNQRNQTGEEPSEAAIKVLRNQIWEDFVTNRLYHNEIDRLGLTVTNQEIIDAVRGDNPPSFLRAQFTDSTGTFNRQMYDAAISDPRNRQVMIQLEAAIREQKLREKLHSVILSGITVSEEEVMRKYWNENVTCDLEYILINPNKFILDSEITVTEQDARAYYDKHIRDYRVEPTRTLKYVRFLETPSPEDSSYVREEMADILKRASEGANFEELAAANSNTPATDAYYSRGELTPAKDSAVFLAKAGDIVGPILERDGYHLIKVLDFQQGSDYKIHAQHVLISVKDGDNLAAVKKAQDILKRAKSGEDIGDLAAEYSDEPGADVRRGDLGWFGRNRMVKPFENAVYAAQPGEITGPVKTEFGFHVIKVIAKDRRQAQIRDILMKIEASPKTRSDIYQKAQDFAYFAKENGFEKEAELDKLSVNQTPAFLRGAPISGLGDLPGINRFAFESELGMVSEAYPISNGYAVFFLAESKEGGVRPFDELKTSIEALVQREKKRERALDMAKEMKATLRPGDGLEKITLSHPDLKVEKVEGFKVEGGSPPLARDPAFVGAITSLPAGEISRATRSNRGVFIIKMLQKSDIDSADYADDREDLYTQLLQEKRNRYFNEWTANLKSSADIVDNRDIFYR